jgi:hypothetical protein
MEEKTMSDVAAVMGTQVARPLKVLVPLIRKDLKQGNEAAQSAGMPYFRAAGEKMIEAKRQMDHGEFKPWLNRSFDVSYTQCVYYMGLCKTEKDAPGAHFSSIDDYRRRHLGHERTPGSRRDAAWQEPVKQIIGRVDTDTLNLRKAEMNRADEREAQRKLALQLIDIGFKALASKLHPDKGGSRDAMARLNAVRDRLKAHV